MPRKFLARYLPDPGALRHQPGFRYLGRYIQDPRFFHLNRHSVAVAAAIGAFLAFIPIIGQMLIAAILAMWMRVNVIVAVATVWISNPITMPAMLYFSYRLGVWLMGKSAPNADFQPTLHWVWERLEFIWAPFLLGSFVSGVAAALAVYLTVHGLWRIHVLRALSQRQRRTPPN
jgi:uncharacterized protein (DUF2062 family)